jgi:adenylate cyclase
MRALPSFWANTREANRQAVSLLEQAIAIDGEYAFATALCAWFYGVRVPYFWAENVAEAREKALSLAKRAALLDSEDPFVLAVLGAAHAVLHQLTEAVPLIEKSLAIDPNSSFAWQRNGWLRAYLSDPDRAIVCFQRAMRLSPLDPYRFNALLGIGSACLQKEEFEQGIDWLTRGLAERPSATWAWRFVVQGYVALGRMPEAKDALAKFTAGNPGATVSLADKSLIARNPAFRKMHLDALRKAGLPE